ncbi:RteC domain-containing protein [Pseudotamlana agarivorans]
MFFKSVKPHPMQFLIYYNELRSCELRMPKLGIESQLKYLKN